MQLESIMEDVINGHRIGKEEALFIYSQPLDEISRMADAIRCRFLGDSFDTCSIINGKCGNCSENCSFCAQSSRSTADISRYPLLSADRLAEEVRKNEVDGIKRCAIVISGRKLSAAELKVVAQAVRKLSSESWLSICISPGLLRKEEYLMLKEAGVSRIHCNLESSRNYFPTLCSTHSFEEKIQSIKAAMEAGLEVCSGGIAGLGETAEDRIDMALELRDLGIKSIPLNMLKPIPGTPYENAEGVSEEEIRRTIAVYRFILPDAYIRLAAGRGSLPDYGRKCFQSGANAFIAGDMLTTPESAMDRDLEMIRDLGFRIEKRKNDKSNT